LGGVRRDGPGERPGHEEGEDRVVKADPVTLDHKDLIDALNALHMSIDRDLLMRADPHELSRVDTPAEPD
jgi:hypothetical protein